MRYYHLDVFTPEPFSGNSVTVFPEVDLSRGAEQLLRVTQEMHHFESIFLSRGGGRAYSARVFDLLEELPFAGHPVLGAACVLHLLYGAAMEEQWAIRLAAKTVEARTSRRDGRYYAELNQGRPEFLGSVRRDSPLLRIVAALNLEETDLHPDFPPQVISTGLRYLILPLHTGLERARIVTNDFEQLLREINAQFVYVLRIAQSLEGRHWSNDGLIEDVATGSGAGCAAAYLVRYGLCRFGETCILNQGRFVGRPSQISFRVEGSELNENIIVGGDVSVVGEGNLWDLPETPN